MLNQSSQDTIIAHSKLFDWVKIWLALDFNFVHHRGHEATLVILGLVPNCATGETLLRRIHVVYHNMVKICKTYCQGK